ncbi:MAG TPA: putative Ig domain-containing protein, partial [Thermoanaerobaculia bacterium]|nr:putative Ig domain-containing protein [Thermoanaerobaculia bacterium]
TPTSTRTSVPPPSPSYTPTIRPPISNTPTYGPSPTNTPEPKYKISGRVVCMDGKPMKGITVSAGGKSALTDANGNYTISDLSPGTYTVIPSGGAYTFAPPQQTVTLGPDATDVDFMATNGPQIVKGPLGGIVCVKYAGQLTATGGMPPYTWTAAGLPPGLTLNAQTGLISGKPTQSGNYNVTITVIDAAGCSDTETFKMNVKPNKPVILTTALPGGAVCKPYQAQLQGAGGCTPYTWELMAGRLPAGLVLTPDGVIRGEPREVGAFTFTVRLADDLYQLAYQTLTIVIQPNPPVILTTALPPAIFCNDTQYAVQLQATGGKPPYTWALIAGRLPFGMWLDPSGLLQGRPRETGVFVFVVEVTDACEQKAQQTLTLVVTVPPQIITPSNLADVKTHDTLEVQIQVDPPGEYTWTLITDGALASDPQPVFGLPAGVYLDQANGVLRSGGIRQCGWFQFALKATDRYGASDTQWFELKVACDTPTIRTNSLPAATEGGTYMAEIDADGGLPPYEWKVTNLPPQMNVQASGKKLVLAWDCVELPVDTDNDTFDMDNAIYNNNGVVPIIVTVWGADADSIRSGDSIPADKRNFEIAVGTSRLAITTPSYVECKFNGSCDVPFRASGGSGGNTFTVLSDELPPGLTFNGDGLSGTPAEAGLWDVAFEVDDGQGNYRQGVVQIQVWPDPPFQIKTPELPNGNKGDFYMQSLEPEGGNGPYTWSLVPQPGFGLPPGLFLAPNGAIMGMPTASGKYDVLVQVVDSTPLDWGSPLTATRKYVLTIKECSRMTGPGPAASTNGGGSAQSQDRPMSRRSVDP